MYTVPLWIIVWLVTNTFIGIIVSTLLAFRLLRERLALRQEKRTVDTLRGRIAILERDHVANWEKIIPSGNRNI